MPRLKSVRLSPTSNVELIASRSRARKEKAEHTKGLSFGSSAILVFYD
jgi:hypothetical protein